MSLSEVQKIYDLPDVARQEVFDFIDFLYDRYATVSPETPRFSFDWEGSIKAENLTAVELQHQALQYR